MFQLPGETATNTDELLRKTKELLADAGPDTAKLLALLAISKNLRGIEDVLIQIREELKNL